MLQNKKLQSGFTLIELLVVIAIIGILSTLAIVALGNARTKARDAKRVADLKQIATALELYYADNGSYPVIITPSQSLKSPDGNTTYMGVIPSNPTPRNDGNCANLEYSYTVDNQSSPTNYNISTCVGSSSNNITAGSIAYSNTGLFNCGQKITDVDGNQYDTVQIGTQCWMKQNLNTGTMIGSKLADNITLQNQANDSVIEKYCYGYTQQGDPTQISTGTANCNTYGGLYQWQEMMNLSANCVVIDCAAQIRTPHKGICPNGWHVPTDAEVNVLENYVVQVIASSTSQYACDVSTTAWQRCADNSGNNFGGTKGAGKSLKKVGQGSGVGAGDDLVSFSSLLPGYRDSAGTFSSIDSYIGLWQSTQYSSSSGIYRLLGASYSTVYRHGYNKYSGLSVRCLKD